MFSVAIEGTKNGKRFELDLQFENKPKRLIEFDPPQTDDLFQVTVAKGRKFGDSDEGTPCNVSFGDWKAEGTYFDRGSYALVMF